jgi:hypothetical protein
MLVHKNQCTKSRIIPWYWFALCAPFGIYSFLNVCWALNHQNLIEMAQGHISFQSPPFWWFMPTQQKATKRSATSMQMRTQICFDSFFATTWFVFANQLNFLSLSQIHLSRHRERYSKRNWSKIQKLPLFPIINQSPHKRATFDKKRH